MRKQIIRNNEYTRQRNKETADFLLQESYLY